MFKSKSRLVLSLLRDIIELVFSKIKKHKEFNRTKTFQPLKESAQMNQILLSSSANETNITLETRGGNSIPNSQSHEFSPFERTQFPNYEKTISLFSFVLHRIQYIIVTV